MITHRPRNDYVIIKRVNKGETPSGIKVADSSLEGIDHIVVAIGRDVQDLKIGDKVLMVGTIKQDYAFLPNSSELLIIKQANIVLVYEEEKEIH